MGCLLHNTLHVFLIHFPSFRLFPSGMDGSSGIQKVTKGSDGSFWMPAVTDAQRVESRVSRSWGREQNVEASSGTEEPDQREKEEVVEEFWEWKSANLDNSWPVPGTRTQRVSLHHARNMQEGGKNWWNGYIDQRYTARMLGGIIHFFFLRGNQTSGVREMRNKDWNKKRGSGGGKVAEMLHCSRPSAERWASQDSDPEEAAVFVDDGVQVLGWSGETLEIWRWIGMRTAAFPLSCLHVQSFYWPVGGITWFFYLFFFTETKKQQFAPISI